MFLFFFWTALNSYEEYNNFLFTLLAREDQVLKGLHSIKKDIIAILLEII